MKSIVLIAGLALAGCASIDATKTDLAVATHADLQAAAQYADSHGYPARAAVWRSVDAQLSAVEAQINACAQAIAAAAPKAPDAAPAGPFVAAEMAAESVGQFSGVPASVKINCAPFPLVTLPALPKP